MRHRHSSKKREDVPPRAERRDLRAAPASRLNLWRTFEGSYFAFGKLNGTEDSELSLFTVQTREAELPDRSKGERFNPLEAAFAYLRT